MFVDFKLALEGHAGSTSSPGWARPYRVLAHVGPAPNGPWLRGPGMHTAYNFRAVRQHGFALGTLTNWLVGCWIASPGANSLIEMLRTGRCAGLARIRSRLLISSLRCKATLTQNHLVVYFVATSRLGQGCFVWARDAALQVQPARNVACTFIGLYWFILIDIDWYQFTSIHWFI